MVNKTKYFMGKDGKISNKRVSPYGKKLLQDLQGVKLHFADVVLQVKGNTLVDKKTGKVIQKINSDRKINKIVYRVL